MKKELLFKRLENVELPEILVARHRDRLRAALLDGSHSRQTSRDAFLPGLWQSVSGAIASLLKGPAWWTAVAGSLTLIIVGVVLGVVFYFAAPSPAVIAADVVKRDPGIQHRLSGTGDIIIVRVEIRDSMASVVCGRSMGDFIEADVDIAGRSVVNTRRFEGLFIPEMALDAQDLAVRIAMADGSIKAMLGKGGSIGKVFPIFSSISNITVINGNLVKVTPAATQAVVPVTLDGKTWLVQVNLEDQKVERIIEPQSGKSTRFDIYYLLRQT